MLLQPLVVSLLVTTFKFSHEAENKTNYIKAAKRIIEAQNFPAKVTALICWRKNDSLKLIKTLSDTSAVNLVKIKPESNNFELFGLPEHAIFLLDLNCNGSEKILEFANQKNLFRHPYKWIIFSPYSRKDEFFIFNYHFFGVDSRIYIVNENGTKTLYKYSRNSTNFVETYLKTDGQYSFIRNRTDVNRTVMKISIVITNSDTVNHLWDSRDTHVDAITKVNYILVHHLTDYINASREFIIQPTWGYKNATTGIYSGMAGDLQRGIAELGGTPLFFTVDRVDIIDYIAATTPTFMKFIFRAPPLTYVTNVFTLPFDAKVWHYSFVMIAVILICVYVIVIWEWKEPNFRKKIEDKFNSLRPNVFDVFMMEVGAITQQGTDVEPKSISGRIATIFTFLVLMFMYTSYSANIVALLQSTTDSIRTLEDLLGSRIKLGVEDIVYAHYYFENAREPVRKAIYEQKVAPKGQKPNFMSVVDGIKKVQEGLFAFHVEVSSGYKVVNDIFQEHEKCGLKEIVYVNLIEPWISVRKKSVYKEIMKVGMRKIHESGIQQRELSKIYTRKPVCLTRGSNFGSVGLIDCYSAFLIFGVGIGICVVILVVEVAVMRWSVQKLDPEVVDKESTRHPDQESEFLQQ